VRAKLASSAPAAVLRDSAAMAAPAASPAVKSIIGRWPSERTAAALVIGADTVLVSGPRDAPRSGIVSTSPIEVRDSLPWLLVVAHEHDVGPFRILLGGLSLAAWGVLPPALLRQWCQ